MADIFVSYTSSDRDWAFWIGQQLEKLGHTARIHEWEISGGGDIAAWMEERHNSADHILCVVSETYLTKPYSRWERLAAQWAAQADRPNFALPVFIEDCKSPTLLAQFKRCDLHDVDDEEDARAQLAAFLTPAARPSSPVRFPGSRKSVGRVAAAPMAFPGARRTKPARQQDALSNIPISVPLHFLGREVELDAIRTALGRGTGRVAITALYGLRGVGKSTLAAAYADEHRADYRARWWIRAQTDATMRADLVGLGVRLGWVAADEKEAAALAATLERLRHEGDRILLIYDNAIDRNAIGDYFPRGGATQIIVTSNAPNWRGVAAPVAIAVWPREIGADYLIEAAGREGERDAALALSDMLGGLPLAHEQAAAYCDRLGVSLGEYRKRFAAAPGKLLDDTRDVARDYGLTVSKTFALAIDEAAKRHPAAAPLIEYAALLAPEPIPLFLFAEAREKFGEPLASALAGDGLDEAVAALRAFALIDRESIADERDPSITTDCIRLHRLVREVGSSRCTGDARQNYRIALLEALVATYPRELLEEPRSWPRKRRLDPIALGLVGGAMALPDAAAEAASELLDRIAGFRHFVLAAHVEAQKLYERSLEIRERKLGPEHPTTLVSIHHLADLLGQKGDFAGAQVLHERGLVIAERLFGTEHPETAASVHGLAGVLLERGDVAAARPLCERALATYEKVLGPEHPHTATCLNDLALLLEKQGDLAGARPLCERASAIYEKVFGPDHPHTAASVHNLAFLLRKQGDFAAARPLYDRALAIAERIFGSEYPNTNLVRRHLASLLLASGNPSEALSLGQRALAGHNEMLGGTHHWTKDSASVTADSLDALGRNCEAKALREKHGIAP